MTSGTGRWLAPLGAAAAVLAVFVVPGVVAALGSSGGPGPGPGPDGVLSPARPSFPIDGGEEDRATARDVEIIGYTARGRNLRVYYTVDQSADCSSRIEQPQVTETANAVLVRLDRRRSRAPDVVCTHLLLTNSVDVLLSRPMGERVLGDGARGGSVVPLNGPYRGGEILATPPSGRPGR